MDAVEIMQEAQVGEGSSIAVIPPKDVRGVALATVETRTIAAADSPKPLKYSLPELREIGTIMFESGMFKDLRSVQQAMVKLLAGAELGYGPFHSLRAFHVIEGKPTETSGEISARIKRSSKYDYESFFIDIAGTRLDPIKDATKEVNASVVVIKELVDGKWKALDASVFTKQDAITAGLLGKQVWKAYLRNMLFARALTNAARFHCADIFDGAIYTPEELGADVIMGGDGELIVVEPTDPKAPPSPVDRKPITGAAIKALYADARAVDPTLPEDIRTWAMTALENYDGQRNPKGSEMLVLEDRLREMLAAGTEVQNTPPLTQEPAGSESLPVEPTEPAPEPARAPEAVSTPQDEVRPGHVPAGAPHPGPYAPPEEPLYGAYGAAPANEGEPMTRSTQGRLFASLHELGYKGKERHSWVTSYGLEVPRDASGTATFAALREPLASWLADRARDEVRLMRMNAAPKAEKCEACGADPDIAHSEGCPVGDPPQ